MNGSPQTKGCEQGFLEALESVPSGFSFCRAHCASYHILYVDFTPCLRRRVLEILPRGRRLNKSWRNDRRPGEISNAILQFARYLICRNSYNSSVANILLTEIIGPRGGRIARRQDAPMHRWRQGVCGLQIAISLKHDGESRSEAGWTFSFRPPARTRGVIGFVIICIMWAKIKNTVCNKIISVRQSVLVACATKCGAKTVCNWRQVYSTSPVLFNRECLPRTLKVLGNTNR